jgi:hypothetical protein
LRRTNGKMVSPPVVWERRRERERKRETSHRRGHKLETKQAGERWMVTGRREVDGDGYTHTHTHTHPLVL